MTVARLTKMIAVLIFAAALSACWGKDVVETCDEPQPYQAETRGERIEVPEGLDELDKLRELPLPDAETAPRPDGARCIDEPPSILTGTST